MLTHVPIPCDGCWVPQVHKVCPHNELSALCKRVLAPLPAEVTGPVSDQFVLEMGRWVALARKYTQGRWSLERTALSYSGAMRRRYLQALESLEDEALDVAKDARLDCFLKAEKVDPVSKVPKARLIFPRSPRYNLALASRLKPFEHWLWSVATCERLGLPGVGRVSAKGLNLRQRASVIQDKFERIDDCVAVEVDGSAFEAHVGRASLLQEQRVYRAAFPGDKGLRGLLGAQLRLFAKMPSGLQFSREAGRASGDFNTGMGNTLVMSACVASVMHDFPSWDFLADGDNALIFVPRRDLPRLEELVRPRALASCGQELTVEKPVDYMEGIVFGRSQPVWFPDGYRLVRNPYRVLSGMTSSHAWLREPSFRAEYIAGVMRCEAAMATGVPMLQSAVWALLDDLADVTVRDHVSFRDYAAFGVSPGTAARRVKIDPRTRNSFALAFGISPERQVFLEEQLARLSYRTGPYLDLDPMCSDMDLPPHLDVRDVD